MTAPLRYPRIAPNVRSSVDGLGSSFTSGGEFPTDTIDYIKFTEVEVDYKSGGGLSSIQRNDDNKATTKNLGSCYLYIPQSLGTDYGVNYDQVSMGAIGVEAAAMLGSQSESEIVASLQSAASSASPEALFNTIGTGISGVNAFLGTSGGPTGSQLSAIGQGLAFNPFMEQVFQGVNFRSHSFSFKLIARSETEAKEIASIVKFFKMGMLPSLADSSAGLQGVVTPPKTPETTPPESETAQGPTPEKPPENPPPTSRTSGSRYLKVPNRFKLEFTRANVSLGSTGNIVSSNAVQPIQGLYKFKECALTNVQVAYTPDGQYVSTINGFVPAIQLDLRFVELSILTKNDYDNVSLFNY
jgi:hypothetical protein